MFNQILLLLHAILRKPSTLRVGDKEMQIAGISINTSPALLIEPDYDEGWRAANRSELEEFVKKYKPGSLLEIHDVDEHTESTMFGTMAKVFKTEPEGKIAQATQNPIWGLPTRTLVLWVREAVDVTIEKLLSKLDEYDPKDFSEEIQYEWYWIEQEARVGIDRKQARAKLEEFLKKIRNQKSFEEHQKALKNNN